jgi:hypothetical protein
MEGTMTKRYRFVVEMTGVGENPDAAWDNAIEAFNADPGMPSATEIDYDQDGLSES